MYFQSVIRWPASCWYYH